MKTNKQICGFSLTELLVAMAISLVLLLGVTKIMVSSKQAYYAQNDMGLLLENARFAIEFLNNDLRMAGYFGCSNPLDPPDTPLIGADNGLNDDDGVNGSDVIQVSFMETGSSTFSVVHAPPQYSTVSPLQQGLTTFTVTTRGELSEGDRVVASDCAGISGTYTVADPPTYTTVVINAGLNRPYNNRGASFGAELRRLVTRRYYIGSSGDGFSLFRDDGPFGVALGDEGSNPEEIIEGVENMQIRYGEDTDNDRVINQYRNADSVADWNNIVAVRITLLLNTITKRNVEPDTETYALDPESSAYDPPDDYLHPYLRRSVFTTTVKLRNINQ